MAKQALAWFKFSTRKYVLSKGQIANILIYVLRTLNLILLNTKDFQIDLQLLLFISTT